MRGVQRKNIQIKCNFCMEWMSLNTDIKLNINICNSCLETGCTSNNLRAISSEGQIYQVYIIKQNSSITVNQTIQGLKKQQQQNNSTETEQDGQLKVEFLEQIDQYRNFQLKDILLKWQAITQFIKQKQKLSIEEINYLKNICQSRTQNLKKIHQQLKNEIENSQSKYIQFTQTNQNIFQTSLNTKIIQKNKQKNIENVKKLTYIEDKQNYSCSQLQLIDQNFTNLRINHQINILSPKKKQPLQQKNLNILNFTGNNASKTSISKRLKTSNLQEEYLNDENIFIKSQISNKITPIKLIRSNSRLISLDKFQQGIRKQQIIKYKAAKSRAVNYLQKNYESSSLTRLMLSLVLQAYANTSQLGRSLQLISFNLSHTDFRCYLQTFQWNNIQVIKLVKTKLSDEQFKILIDFIYDKQIKIKVIVLTSNKLTEKSIQYLYENKVQNIQQIYLGKNSIKKFKIKSIVNYLSSKYSIYL